MYIVIIHSICMIWDLFLVALVIVEACDFGLSNVKLYRCYDEADVE